eukprot:2633520-Prymnesium_polylepis.1
MHATRPTGTFHYSTPSGPASPGSTHGKQAMGPVLLLGGSNRQSEMLASLMRASEPPPVAMIGVAASAGVTLAHSVMLSNFIEPTVARAVPVSRARSILSAPPVKRSSPDAPMPDANSRACTAPPPWLIFARGALPNWRRSQSRTFPCASADASCGEVGERATQNAGAPCRA